MAKAQRSVKSWSTREQIAEELDRVAAKLQERWGYTLDRSKLLNAFCSALFKADKDGSLDAVTTPVVGEESLEEAICAAICRSRR